MLPIKTIKVGFHLIGWCVLKMTIWQILNFEKLYIVFLVVVSLCLFKLKNMVNTICVE